MKESNYILFGVAVSYFLIAIIQMKMDGLLPASLYVTVAFVSLEFTVFEMFKSVIDCLVHNLQKTDIKVKSRKEFIKKSIKIYDRFNILKSESKKLEDELIMLSYNENLTRNNGKIKRLKGLFFVMSCIQTIVCTMQIMITPLKLIPYDKLTNKVINIVTLVSFACMFLSCFFSNLWNEHNDFQEERWHIYEVVSSDYLEMLEKIASENEKINI